MSDIKKPTYTTTYKGKDNDVTIKQRQNTDNPSAITIDKYTKVDKGKHIHESASLDKETGEYKHYGGGENGDERSYNKKNDSTETVDITNTELQEQSDATADTTPDQEIDCVDNLIDEPTDDSDENDGGYI